MRSPDARWVELGALTLAALFALVFHLTLPSRLPSEEDHRAAAAHLTANAAEGDVLLLSPWWTERARLYAPASLPVVGYLGSDADPLADHRRIWVLAQPDLPRAARDDFERAFLPGREAIGEASRFGPLELRLYENGRYRPARWRATEALDSAQVFLETPDGARRDCPRVERSFRCPGGPHMAVAVEWHEVLYEPRRCVNLHAPGGEAKLVVEFASAPEGLEYTLEAGIIWEHAFRHAPHLTVTEVEASGRGASLRVDLPPGLEGVQRARGTLGGGPLRLSVASRVAEARQACVELVGREAQR